MLNRHNLEIASLASKEESRYSLSAILIEPGHTIVTDGHLAATVTTPNLPADQVPIIEGFKPTLEFAPFMLPAADALAISKAIPNGRNTNFLPILQNAFVDAGENGKARIAVTNLDTSRVFDIKKTAGVYPKIDMVIPKREDAEIAISLNPSYLVSLLRVLSPIVDKTLQTCMLHIKDPESPIRIDCRNTETGQEGIGILMPMKGAETHGVLPRKLTMELEDGKVKNIWSDQAVEIAIVQRNFNPEKDKTILERFDLWTARDISQNYSIPQDIRDFLNPIVAEAEGAAVSAAVASEKKGKRAQGKRSEPRSAEVAAVQAVEEAKPEAPESTPVDLVAVLEVAIPEPPVPAPAGPVEERVKTALAEIKKRRAGGPGKPPEAEPAPVSTTLAMEPEKPAPVPPSEPGKVIPIRGRKPRKAPVMSPTTEKAPEFAPKPEPKPAGDPEAPWCRKRPAPKQPTPESLAKMRAASLAYWAGVRAAKKA